MRKFVSIVLISSVLLLCAVPAAIAGKKEAGKIIGDSTYVDNKFGFSFTKPGTWKFKKVFEDKDIERLILIQKSPVVPAQFAKHRSYFTQPQVTILAYEADIKAKKYKDVLLAEKGKDKLRKKAYQEFILLQQDSKYSFEVKRTRSVKVGGKHGVRIIGRKEYYWDFGGGDHISDFMSGSIYVIDADNGIVLIEFVCEREMLRTLQSDFDAILGSFVFFKSEQKESKEN